MRLVLDMFNAKQTEEILEALKEKLIALIKEKSTLEEVIKLFKEEEEEKRTDFGEGEFIGSKNASL